MTGLSKGHLRAPASGQDGFDAVESGFATNGYGDRSPGGYSLLAVLLAGFSYRYLTGDNDRVELDEQTQRAATET